MQVGFSIHGDQTAERGFRRLARGADDLRDPLGQLEDEILADVQRQFQTEGFGRWKVLSPAYEAWKERVAPGRPMLVLTGSLRQYLTSEQSVQVAGDRLRALLPAELYKLEGRGISTAGTADRANEVFESWLSGLVRESFRGRD
jgi:hypothetical protein